MLVFDGQSRRDVLFVWGCARQDMLEDFNKQKSSKKLFFFSLFNRVFCGSIAPQEQKLSKEGIKVIWVKWSCIIQLYFNNVWQVGNSWGSVGLVSIYFLMKHHFPTDPVSICAAIMEDRALPEMSESPKSSIAVKLGWSLVSVRAVAYDSHHFHVHHTIHWPPEPREEASAIALLLSH